MLAVGCNRLVLGLQSAGDAVVGHCSLLAHSEQRLPVVQVMNRVIDEHGQPQLPQNDSDEEGSE